MKHFIHAGDNLINTNELLYITRCLNKPIYVAQFIQHAPTGAKCDNQNSKLFLDEAEYKDFLTNLANAKS